VVKCHGSCVNIWVSSKDVVVPCAELGNFPINKPLLVIEPPLAMELRLAQLEPGQLEAAQLTAWMFKDLGWVMMIPFISLPAAVFAILFTLHILYQSLRTNRSSSIVLLVGELLWLLGNSTWMLSEVLWDLPAYHLPWSFTPLIRSKDDDALYGRGSLLALVLFGLGLVVILVAFVVLCIRQCCLSDAHQRAHYVFGLVSEDTYSRSFITFWIAKDMFWVWEEYRVALAMGILALCMVLDSARRFRAQDPPDTHSACLMIVYMLWILGQVVWMTEEVPLKEMHPILRMVSGGLFASGLLMIWCITVVREKCAHSRNCDRSSPLV